MCGVSGRVGGEGRGGGEGGYKYIYKNEDGWEDVRKEDFFTFESSFWICELI